MSKYVQTVEQTGKRWKAMGCLAMLMIIAGMVIGGIYLQFGAEDWMLPTIISLLLVGLILGFTAKLGSWWYHQ